MNEWWVTSNGQIKRIHRPECRHRRHEYAWARGKSPQRLVDDLRESGAWQWHRGCSFCAPDVDQGLIGLGPLGVPKNGETK